MYGKLHKITYLWISSLLILIFLLYWPIYTYQLSVFIIIEHLNKLLLIMAINNKHTIEIRFRISSVTQWLHLRIFMIILKRNRPLPCILDSYINLQMCIMEMIPDEILGCVSYNIIIERLHMLTIFVLLTITYIVILSIFICTCSCVSNLFTN